MPALQMVGGRTVLLQNAGISQEHTISIVKKVYTTDESINFQFRLKMSDPNPLWLR